MVLQDKDKLFEWRICMNGFLEKLAKKNFKKIGIGFIIISLVAIIGIGITGYLNFGSRVKDWNQQNEVKDSSYETTYGTEEVYSSEIGDSKENENNDATASEGGQLDNEEWSAHRDKGAFESEHNEKHEIKFEKMINLTTVDKIFIGVAGIILALIAGLYWILVTLWMVRRAYLDGANYVLFGFGAFFINLAAVIVYYIYRSFISLCPSCGKLLKKDTEFCVYCGTDLKSTCPKCGVKIDKKYKFCSKCGTKQ